MTGKHYHWHKRWVLDAPESRARHESGMSVRYVTEFEYSDMPPADIGGRCWHDGQTWVVVCTLSDAELQTWLMQQQAQGVRGRDVLQKRVARLMREAGELWIHHKEKDGRQ